MINTLKILPFPVWMEPLAALGIPYVWGAGDLTNTHNWPSGVSVRGAAANGYDCSGFILAALANCAPPGRSKLDLVALRKAYGSDMHSSAIADACVPVQVPAPGDIFYYKGHVMLVIGGPRMLLLGASGGDSSTYGQKPDAFVKVQRWDYRRDLITAMRFKPQFLLAKQEETG